MIYKKSTGQEVEYFTKEEADARNISYIPWREARQEGQWVLSDDHLVLQTQRVKEIKELHGRKERTRYRIRTTLGSGYPHGRMSLCISEHIEKRCTSAFAPQYWWEQLRCVYPEVHRELRNALMGKLLRDCAGPYTREEYRIFQKIGTEQLPFMRAGWVNVKRYYAKEQVRMSLRQEIQEKAKEWDFNVDKVFNLIQKAETKAKDTRDFLAVAKEIAGIVGITHMLKAKSDPESNRIPLPDEDSVFEQVLTDDRTKL